MDDAVFIMGMRESVREVARFSLRLNAFEDTFAEAVREHVFPPPPHVVSPTVSPKHGNTEWRDICGACDSEKEESEEIRRVAQSCIEEKKTDEMQEGTTRAGEKSGPCVSRATEERTRTVTEKKKNKPRKSKNMTDMIPINTGKGTFVRSGDSSVGFQAGEDGKKLGLETHSGADTLSEPVSSALKPRDVALFHDLPTPPYPTGKLHVVTIAS